jgi:hypothetical protein
MQHGSRVNDNGCIARSSENIHVAAALEVLQKKERGDETQFTIKNRWKS